MTSPAHRMQVQPHSRGAGAGQDGKVGDQGVGCIDGGAPLGALLIHALERVAPRGGSITPQRIHKVLRAKHKQ